MNDREKKIREQLAEVSARTDVSGEYNLLSVNDTVHMVDLVDNARAERDRAEAQLGSWAQLLGIGSDYWRPAGDPDFEAFRVFFLSLNDHGREHALKSSDFYRKATRERDAGVAAAELAKTAASARVLDLEADLMEVAEEKQRVLKQLVQAEEALKIVGVPVETVRRFADCFGFDHGLSLMAMLGAAPEIVRRLRAESEVAALEAAAAEVEDSGISAPDALKRLGEAIRAMKPSALAEVLRGEAPAERFMPARQLGMTSSNLEPPPPKLWPGGPSLRDWFAGQALSDVDVSGLNHEDIAARCYAAADAMLVASRIGPRCDRCHLELRPPEIEKNATAQRKLCDLCLPIETAEAGGAARQPRCRRCGVGLVDSDMARTVVDWLCFPCRTGTRSPPTPPG